MNRLVFFIISLSLFGCKGIDKNSMIQTKYCIVNDEYNSMQIDFKIKNDSIFLFYCNIVDGGNYINGCSFDNEDSLNYAGFFLLPATPPLPRDFIAW